MTSKARSHYVPLPIAQVRVPMLPYALLRDVAWRGGPDDDANIVRFYRENPAFRVAVRTASRELHEALQDPNPDVARVATSLRRYLIRCVTKPTPFAATAGVAVVPVTAEREAPHLELGAWSLHARLSSREARRLLHSATRIEPALVSWVVAASAQQRGANIVFEAPAPARASDETELSLHPFLETLLATRPLQRTYTELVQLAAENDDATADEVVRQAIAAGLLHPSPGLAEVSTQSPLDQLLAILAPATTEANRALRASLETLRELTARPMTLDPTHTAATLTAAEDVVRQTAEPRASAGTETRPKLDLSIVTETSLTGVIPQQLVQRVFNTLNRLSGLWAPVSAELPGLLEVLDKFAPGGEIPFLDLVHRIEPMMKREASAARRGTPFAAWWSAIVAKNMLRKNDSIAIDEADIAALPPSLDTTPTFAEVLLTPIRTDGKETVLVQLASERLFLLGRFLGLPGHEGLRAAVRNAIAHTDETYAELASPSRVMAELSVRPPLTQRRIVASAPPGSDDIAFDDLVVRHDSGRVVLWSRSRGCVVTPVKLDALHATQIAPVERLLLALAPFRAWPAIPDLGDGAPSVPRVTVDGLVIQRKSWQPPKLMHDVATSDADRASKRRVVADWVRWMQLPDAVNLGDEGYVIDPNRQDGVDELVDWLQKKGGDEDRRIVEVFEPWTMGTGRTIEVVVVGTLQPEAPDAPRPPMAVLDHPPLRFGPESNWLSLRLYAPTGDFEDVAARLVPEVVLHEALGEHVANFHFVRFADGIGPHVRLRVQYNDVSGHAALGELLELLQAEVEARRVLRWSTDIFEPELVRYGGHASWQRVVQLQTMDSELAIELLQEARSQEDPLFVDLCTMRAVQGLVARFVDGADAVGEAIETMWRGRASAEAGDHKLRAKWLSTSYGANRARFEETLGASNDADVHPALAKYFERAAPIISELKAAPHPEVLVRSIAHMFCNRVLRSTAQETVLYAMIHRALRSITARRRQVT